MQPANLIIGGHFDPKGYPIYQSSLGDVIRIATFSVMLAGPIWLVILGVRLAFMLGRNWTRLLISQRRLGVVAVLSGLSVLVFMVSPLGHLVMTWFAD
ncbi:MAG TPA: hypothetical protein VHO69_01880 [Phototrophicaceae bacterium]|nr:hypothetical protein [Phototrophicaceae bacterium]